MVKKLQNLIKNEKGSITVFVLAAMLLFLTTGGIAYMNVSNKTNAQLEQVEKIQEEYAKGTSPEEIEEIYEEAIKEPEKPVELEVTLTPDTKDWTNKDVTVTITYPEGDITSEVTITGEEGKDYEINEDGTEVIIKTNNTTITVTVEDDSGNSVTEELTISNIDKKGPSVTYMPDGGTYVKPKNSDAIIKTRITATDEGGSGVKTIEYGWSTSAEEQPTEWETILNRAEVKKEDCIEGSYYVWTRVTDNAGNETITPSKEFKVLSTEEGKGQIKLTPNTDDWTNQDVVVKVEYGEAITGNKKVEVTGEEGKDYEISEDGTEIIIKTNQTITVTATDIAGNKITVELEVKNIDKTVPTLTVTPTESNIGKSTKVTITAGDEGGSGLSDKNSYQYQLSTSNTTAPTGTWQDYESGKAQTIGENLNGTYYLWVKEVKDIAENSSTGGTKVGEYHVFGPYVFDNTIPTATITAEPSGNPTNADEITYTFTFSENVKDFTADDIEVTNGTKGEFTKVDDKTYKIVITNTESGEQTVKVAENACTDVAGNGNKEISKTTTIDKTAPTATITAEPSGNPTNADKITYTFTFSENVSGFTADDIEVTNGTKGEFTKVDEKTYKIVVTNTESCEQTVSIKENVCTDEAGNGNKGASKTVTIDKNVPTCNITASTGDLSNADEITYIFTFSRDVTDFTADDIKVENGEKGEFTKVSDTEYTLVVKSTGDGEQTVTIPENVCKDEAGNGNAEASKTITIDRTAPTLSSINVTNPDAGTYKAGQVVTIVATYSENIYGSANAAEITAGTAPVLKIKFGTSTERTATFKNVSGSTITYTYTIANGDNGKLATTSYTGTVYDKVGNKLDVENKALGGNSITADTTLPTCTITANPSENPTNANSITYTFTFSENVTGFAASDITVTNGTKGTFTKVNDKQYTLVVTSVKDGEQITTLAANKCTDAAGNGNTAASKTVTIDRTAPTLSNIKVISPNAGTYKAGQKVTIVATYSENIKGTAPTMTLKFGSTAGKGTVSAGTVSGKAITYTYTITEGDNGLLGINTFTGGSITDNVGNAWTVTSASNTGNSITADTTAPTLSSIKVTSPATGTYKAGQKVTIVATYSETIKGTAPTMTLKFGSTAGKGTVSAGTVSGNSITYTYTITAGDNGLLEINTFTGGSITDSVGNAWTVTSANNTGNSITADTTAPTLSSINVTSPAAGTYKAGQVVTIVATYSENIYGNASKVAITSGTAPVLKIKFGSSTERTATFSSVSGKTITYTYTIASGDNGKLATTSYTGTVYDQAGNSLAVGNKTIGGNAITADTTPPTITSATAPTTWSNTNKQITVKASDTLSGIAGYQITTSNTAPTTWIASTATTWTSTTSYGAGTYYVWVKDKVENVSASKAVTITNIDTTAPTLAVTSNTTFAKSQNATITIGDANSGLAAGTYTIKYTWTTTTTSPTWSDITTTTNITVAAGAKTGTATVSKSSGTGTYYLHVQAVNLKDQAGNTVSPTKYGTFKFDNTAPTVNVSPAAGAAAKSRSITITTTDTGGSNLSSPSYQYQLSTSNTTVPTGTWSTYTSGTAFTIGTNLNGTYYLWVKEVKDGAGNVSTTRGTKVSTYHVFGSYIFDNITPTASVATVSGYYTDSSLVGWYDAEYNTSKAHSSSATKWTNMYANNSASLTNVTWGTNYAQFNGTSSYANLGEINSNYMTIEATFSVDKDITTSGSTGIIGNWDAGGGGIWIAYQGANKDYCIGGEYYIGGGYKTIISDVKVETGRIYHVSITYNGSNVILYINGKQEGSVSATGTIQPPENNTIMALGCNPSGALPANGSYFTGKIYSARVYTSAISAANVMKNYQADIERYNENTVSATVSYTHVTDGLQVLLDGYNCSWGGHITSGTSWADLSGNNKNGTLKNGPTWGSNYLKFDGTDDWVSLGQINANYMSIEATFMLNEINSGNNTIIGNWETRRRRNTD